MTERYYPGLGAVQMPASGQHYYPGTGAIQSSGGGGGSPDGTAAGTTLTGTATLTAGTATGGTVVDGTAPGATLTGTGQLSAGAATGGSSGSFTTSPMENNTGAGVLASTAVDWTWCEGAIGAVTGMTHGSGTTNAGGVLVVPGLPAGAGFLLAATEDGAGVYYEAGTVA